MSGYTYKIWSDKWWYLADKKTLINASTHQIETENDLEKWIDKFNESKPYKTLSSAGAWLKTIYCVVIQNSKDKKESWDGVPSGAFRYPSDRESLKECEDMIEKLKVTG